MNFGIGPVYEIMLPDKSPLSRLSLSEELYELKRWEGNQNGKKSRANFLNA